MHTHCSSPSASRCMPSSGIIFVKSKPGTHSGWRANDSCRNTEGGQHARTNGVCSGIRNTASHMRLLSAQAFAAQAFLSFILVCDAECMLQALQRGRQFTQLPCCGPCAHHRRKVCTLPDLPGHAVGRRRGGEGRVGREREREEKGGTGGERSWVGS